MGKLIIIEGVDGSVNKHKQKCYIKDYLRKC